MALMQCPECKGVVSSEAEKCPHCGYPLKGQEKPNVGQTSLKKEGAEKKRRNGGLIFACIGSFVSLVGISLGIIFIGNTSTNTNIGNTSGSMPFIALERDATSDDYSFSQSEEATLTTLKDTYKILPKYDIKNLQIEITYCKDSIADVVKKTTIEFSSVTKGSTYYKEITHTISEMMSIKRYSYKTLSGKVKL